MRTLLLVLCLSVSVSAQIPVCETKQHGKEDHRTKCDGSGYGVKQRQDGTVDEMRYERSVLLMGKKRWKSKKMPPPVMELDPMSSGPVTPGGPVTHTGDSVIDVMVLRASRAEAAQGTSAMDALVVNAIARANLSAANGLVTARFRLVYTGRVAYTEGQITTDLGRLQGRTDGYMDSIHALRQQVGADLVVLLGAGYVAQGAAGQGYLMRGTAYPAFAQFAFSVVDYTQASAYLSMAHEMGHNSGLQHNFANAGCGTSCTGFAYGYKVPNVFRTVMSYGGEPRIPYFSNPSALYNGRPVGAPTQDNSRALEANAVVVSQFMPEGTPVPVPPPPVCRYTVTPGTLEVQPTGGSFTVWVATTTSCGWASMPSPVTWASAKGAQPGSGPAIVTVQTNLGAERSVTLRVAAQNVVVNQKGQQ